LHLCVVFVHVWNWTASRSGNVGVVFHANSSEAISDLLKNGTDPPYIVVMDAELFHTYVIYLCCSSSK